MAAFKTILQQITDVRVLDKKISLPEYCPLDLSAANATIANVSGDSAGFESYLKAYTEKKNARVAFGGYNEKRSIYKRSGLFNDEGSDERNIHIGLDLWTKAGTSVLAALDGKVHSFDFNAGTGDYGPTIILEHEAENFNFYTLYGHLSLKSISELEIGETFAKGQQIGTLGDASVNGDYAPHLHFQIIRNIGDCFGDYPGVCSESDLLYFLDNCPDPNLLLKIK